MPEEKEIRITLKVEAMGSRTGTELELVYEPCNGDLIRVDYVDMSYLMIFKNIKCGLINYYACINITAYDSTLYTDENSESNMTISGAKISRASKWDSVLLECILHNNDLEWNSKSNELRKEGEFKRGDFIKVISRNGIEYLAIIKERIENEREIQCYLIYDTVEKKLVRDSSFSISERTKVTMASSNESKLLLSIMEDNRLKWNGDEVVEEVEYRPVRGECVRAIRKNDKDNDNSYDKEFYFYVNRIEGERIKTTSFIRIKGNEVIIGECYFDISLYDFEKISEDNFRDEYKKRGYMWYSGGAIRFKTFPLVGNQYFYLGSDLTICSKIWMGNKCDFDLFEVGNCYRTEDDKNLIKRMNWYLKFKN